MPSSIVNARGHPQSTSATLRTAVPSTPFPSHSPSPSPSPERMYYSSTSTTPITDRVPVMMDIPSEANDSVIVSCQNYNLMDPFLDAPSSKRVLPSTKQILDSSSLAEPKQKGHRSSASWPSAVYKFKHSFNIPHLPSTSFPRLPSLGAPYRRFFHRRSQDPSPFHETASQILVMDLQEIADRISRQSTPRTDQALSNGQVKGEDGVGSQPKGDGIIEEGSDDLITDWVDMCGSWEKSNSADDVWSIHSQDSEEEMEGCKVQEEESMKSQLQRRHTDPRYGNAVDRKRLEHPRVHPLFAARYGDDPNWSVQGGEDA